MSSNSRRLALLGLVVPFVTVMGGCASAGLLERLTPYRIDIVQGNVVTSEQLAQLRPGMTRAQVRDLLGSPMVTDPFHASRWDYPFSIRRQGTEIRQRSVVVWFEGDTMKSVQAPDLPTEREFVAGISPLRSRLEPRELSLSDEQLRALPKPARKEAVAEEPMGPVRSYPPLEGS
jgi:outer membrane protein assembly factor BamE